MCLSSLSSISMLCGVSEGRSSTCMFILSLIMSAMMIIDCLGVVLVLISVYSDHYCLRIDRFLNVCLCSFSSIFMLCCSGTYEGVFIDVPIFIDLVMVLSAMLLALMIWP